MNDSVDELCKAYELYLSARQKRYDELVAELKQKYSEMGALVYHETIINILNEEERGISKHISFGHDD